MEDLFDALDTIRHAMGAAGKKAGLDVTAEDLGADRAMSGLRRRAKVTAGYDIDPKGVTLNMRPVGLMILAHGGRTKTKRIGTNRRRNTNRKTMLTPWGFRSSAWSLPSRGHRTISRIIERCSVIVPPVVEKSVDTMIEKSL